MSSPIILRKITPALCATLVAGGFTGIFAQAETSDPAPSSDPVPTSDPVPAAGEVVLTRDKPFIYQVENGELTGTLGNISVDETETNFAISTPGTSFSEHYLVGVVVGMTGSSEHTGTLLAKGETITVDNGAANSGAIALGIAGDVNIAHIGGTLKVDATQEVRGLGLSGATFSAEGARATLGNFTGTIDVTSTGTIGSAYGIDLEYGTIEKMENATIKVTSGAAAVGIKIGAGGTFKDPYAQIGFMNKLDVDIVTNGATSSATALQLGNGAGLAFPIIDESGNKVSRPNDGYIVRDADVKVTGKNGQLSFANAFLTPEVMAAGGIGLISGDFEMISDNTADQADGANVSVGYLLGSQLLSTTASLGFKNTNDDATLKFANTSTGFLLDWSSTNMKIHRNYGFAVGSTIVGTEFVNGLGLNNTVLGTSNKIEMSVGVGTAAAIWLNGVNLDEGALLGKLIVNVGQGVAVGMGSGGSDLPGTHYVTQSNADTTLNIVAGTISATVETEGASLETMVVGAQIGAAFGDDTKGYKHYRTIFAPEREATEAIPGVEASEGVEAVEAQPAKPAMEAGAFYGVITAQINDAANESGELNAGNVVTGILNYGSVNEDHFKPDADGNAVYSTKYGYRLDSAEDGPDKIRFNATAVDGDAAGARVSALIYDAQSDGSKKLVGLGNAIQSLIGDTIITTNSTYAGNTTRLIGNITTGGDLLNTAAGSKMAGQRKLIFESGHFTVTSESWNAEDGVTFGSVGSVARVVMTDVLTVNERDAGTSIAENLGSELVINSSTLNFHAQNTHSSSVLILGTGMTLDLNGEGASKSLTINIHLEGTEEDYAGASPLYFIDATKTANFDDDKTNITYKLFLDGKEVKDNPNFEIRHDETGVYLFIPEPSTATMSLLALSSLLARRRRRKV